MGRLAPLARRAFGAALLGLLLYLASAAPAGARPREDDPTLTFRWDDPKMKEAFRGCMEVVDWVAHGASGQLSVGLDASKAPPGGIEVGLWLDAIDSAFFRKPRGDEFAYRPRCDLLLPRDYERRISIRFYSEAYVRCGAVVGGDTAHPRPDAVPTWYWGVSLEIGDCYLLLPLGAYGLGQDENDWSRWRTEDEVDYPTSHSDPDVGTEYRACLDFVDRRLGQGFRNPTDGADDDPPRGASPREAWHEAIDLYVDHGEGAHVGAETTVPANWHSNCELLLSVTPTSGFRWGDPRMKEAFRACMALVDYVAHGSHGGMPATGFYPWQDVPGGIDRGHWRRAVGAGYFESGRSQGFTYRPNCDLLLPDDYETMIATRYHSDVYGRCLLVVGGETAHERPKVVPAWYWEASKIRGDCYLLLPLGAFGLGEDENEWSRWTADDEVVYPTSNPDPDVMEEYRICREEYIQWRMDNGHADWGGPGSKFDDPPREAAPKRVWQEATDFYVNHDGDGDETVPANWHPNCELLLAIDQCKPSSPSNPSLLPEQCLGPHPTSHYDIGYSQYDDPDEEGTPSIGRNLWGGSTNFAFTIGKGGVQVSMWAVGWAYTFDVSKYDPLAIRVGDSYQTNLLGQPGFRLRELFWLVLFVWAGATALRGRLAVAGSEILITVVLLMLSAVLMQQREMYMDATWNLMDKASTALLVAGMGHEADDDTAPRREQLIEDLQKRIHFTFVEEPYDYLNWGRSLGDPNDPGNALRTCAAARYYILSMGPHGTDRWPRQQMAAAGTDCPQELVEFNRNPDGTRLLGAILVMFSALAVAILLTIVALTVVVAKLVAVMIFGLVPFFAVVMILPAYGRRLGWAAFSAAIQVVTAVIGMSFLLSLLLLTLTELTGLSGDVALIERFALMDLVVFIVFAARRNLLQSGQAFAGRLSEFLSSTRASGATWASAATAAGASRSGLDLLNVDRAAAGAVGGPLRVGVASTLLRLHEHRSARHSYRNLERVAIWKRARNTSARRWVVRHDHRPRRLGLRHRRILAHEPATIPTRRNPLP